MRGVHLTPGEMLQLFSELESIHRQLVSGRKYEHETLVGFEATQAGTVGILNGLLNATREIGGKSEKVGVADLTREEVVTDDLGSMIDQ